MNAMILTFITFVSCTECPKDIRGFLNIPADGPCDMIKWKLDVLDNGKYQLNAQWGHYVDNRTWKQHGDVTNSKGTYKVDRTVYTFNNGTATLAMLRLNDNMLQLMSSDKKMLPGGEGFANMLTRTDPVVDRSIDFEYPKPQTKKEDFVVAGRTPLRPFDKELPIADKEDHEKIKWLIRFYADGRVEVREILEHVRDWKGTWTVEKGIYKLDFEGRQLLLLKASDDIFYFVSKDGGLINGNSEFGSALIRRSPSAR